MSSVVKIPDLIACAATLRSTRRIRCRRCAQRSSSARASSIRRAAVGGSSAVLLNDSNLKRTAGVDRSALEMTARELAEVSVNEEQRFQQRYTDVGIPTLAQAVEPARHVSVGDRVRRAEAREPARVRQRNRRSQGVRGAQVGRASVRDRLARSDRGPSRASGLLVPHRLDAVRTTRTSRRSSAKRSRRTTCSAITSLLTRRRLEALARSVALGDLRSERKEARARTRRARCRG